MIDYWCNAFTPDRAPLWSSVISDGALAIRTAGDSNDDGFTTVDRMAARMDRLGVVTLILPVCELATDAPLTDFAHYALRPHEIEGMSTVHPRHFRGMYSVDPTAGVGDVDRAAAALDQEWCVALHTHTHSWGLGFDHVAYTPYYALCRDRSVPFVMQAGRSGGHFDHAAGHPSAIATPARTFPDLVFVLSHTGAPWVDEALAAALEHPNVTVGTATYPPRRWGSALLEFIADQGRDRCLFGTGFPLTGHQRSLTQLDDLHLGEDVRHQLLEGNARRIFSRLAHTPGG